MALETHVRGSTVEFTVSFLDSAGAVMTVTSGTLTLQYEVDGVPTLIEYPLVDDVGDSWTYDWDSSVADPGTISWHTRSDPSPKSAANGKIKLLGNAANE